MIIKYLEVKDIWYLENFLKKRFQFNNIDTKVEYEDLAKIKPIDKEWENIVCYVAHKHPIAKDMLFKKSEVEIENETVHVKMHVPGLNFLKAKKADLEIENTIENFFGKKYKIDITEQVTQEDRDALKENSEKTQKRIIT